MTVKRKLTFGLFGIFAVSVLVLYTFMSSVISKATEDKIVKDMENTYVNSREYINQLFIVNSFEFTEKAFVKNGSIIVRGLGRANNCYTTIYSVNGKNPYQYIPYSFKASWDEIDKKHENLVDKAVSNQSAVQISKLSHKGEKFLIADFVFPLYINDAYLGIIRFTFDYTDVYVSDNTLLRMLMLFVIIIFIIIFLFSYLLSCKITKPLTRLNEALVYVASGHYGGYVKKESNDELGDLADSFNHMTNKIKEQIETIEAEKKKILELQKTRTEFFNNVTHELKTPLTTIYGYTQLLEGGVDDKEFYDRAINRIKLESDRLHKMVVELIEISKSSGKTKEEYESIELSGIAELMVNDMTFKAEERNMAIETESEEVFIKGDMARISEVFINILDNAIKYGDPYTSIKLKIFNEAGYGVILVENQGKDIPQSVRDKVFEPFFRAGNLSTEEKGSSGLGLYICKNIIDSHGGNVVISSSNRVTRLEIRIPLEKN